MTYGGNPFVRLTFGRHISAEDNGYKTWLPGVDLIKICWSKFTHTFCKLNHFINTSNIYSIAMKRYSLQNRVSKFMPKKFYKIDPRATIGFFRDRRMIPRPYNNLNFSIIEDFLMFNTHFDYF